MTLSMFPEYPDDETHPTQKVIPTVAKTREWVLMRAHGRRINDNPVWHRQRYLTDDGTCVAACGFFGSKVFTEVPNGVVIVPCTECLQSTPY